MAQTVGLQNQTSGFESRLPCQKTCPKCGDEKSEEDFNWKIVGVRRQSYCRKCSNGSSKEHYISNAASYRARNKRRVAEVKELVDAKKRDTPCADCGEFFHPCAMDFDHLHGKRFDIGSAARLGYSNEEILKEIEKCEIVCSNCHRVRTYKRREAPLAVA